MPSTRRPTSATICPSSSTTGPTAASPSCCPGPGPPKHPDPSSADRDGAKAPLTFGAIQIDIDQLARDGPEHDADVAAAREISGRIGEPDRKRLPSLDAGSFFAGRDRDNSPAAPDVVATPFERRHGAGLSASARRQELDLSIARLLCSR